MKLVLVILFATTGLALAQTDATQTSLNTLETALKLVQSKGDTSDPVALAEKILQTYKQTLADAKPLFDAADVQLPKEVLALVPDSSTQVTTTTAAATQTGQTSTAVPTQKKETAALQSSGGLQTGGLPLTLPNVDPTTEPIEQYQMWRKADRDKALHDRYLELLHLARGN